MAHKVVVESKHILTKVSLGVITGVLATVVLYFLLNKTPKATEAEVRKVTTDAWKSYIAAENRTEKLFDSSFFQLQSEFSQDKEKRTQAYKRFWARDSTTSARFINELANLRKKKDIDQDFSILLGARIAYQEQQATASQKYSRRFKAAVDSTMDVAERNQLLIDLNKANTTRQNNITMRVGRNIEYFSSVLTRKYNYPFAFSDISYFPIYMALKRKKLLNPDTGVAPADPKKITTPN